MDQGLVAEIKKLIESAKGHAVFFMNDPPSRAWDGWRGRSNSCIKKAKEICEQTIFSFQGLVNRTKATINELKQQIANNDKTISNLKDQILTLRNSHNQIEQNLNTKIMEKQNEQINRDKQILNLREEVTLLKKVVNQKDKNQAKLKQKIDDVEVKLKKTQYSLQQAKEQLRKAHNQQDKYTEVSKKPSTKDMSKPPTEKSFESGSSSHKSSSEKNFHYQKPMECFSHVNKHSYLKLRNNNTTAIVYDHLDSDINSKYDKIFGFKVLFAKDISAGICNAQLAKDRHYELQNVNDLQKIGGRCEIVRRNEDNNGEMFVGLRYLAKQQQLKIMKASKQGKREYSKSVPNYLIQNMRACLIIRGKCEVSLIEQ